MLGYFNGCIRNVRIDDVTVDISNQASQLQPGLSAASVAVQLGCASNVGTAGCSPPCPNGSTCVGNSTCLCPPGYDGRWCNQTTSSISSCSSLPCLNDGSRCLDVYPDTYRCLCAVGWTGVNCEQPVARPCSSSPCRHNGTCFDGIGDSFTCQCPSGYTGPLCDSASSPCSSNPCRNGSTCRSVDLSGVGYVCDCSQGLTGMFCETSVVIGACGSHPCSNNATCEENVKQATSGGNSATTTYLCVCPPSFTGVTCETPVSQVNWQSNIIPCM